MIPVCDCLPKGEGYDDPEEKIGDEGDSDDWTFDDLDEDEIYLL